MARSAGTRPFQVQDPDKEKSTNQVPIEAEEIPIDQSTTNPIQAHSQSEPQGVGHPLTTSQKTAGIDKSENPFSNKN
ncbi:hypothetical protein IscW_ISCW006180 [Ixodes scapularis]|uniref:Uncharacterized protein n=1 Tax=Ixodes scapularis TaxID=6945 RepID=B7PQA5_IXOSC|nr:hypothetical protein IscW_ISCW006180 [Ixodes scapularis]|eukprot:XP_002435947.1 hypothetical protein IscW_ISCW006180 [Ixodes scapularis]